MRAQLTDSFPHGQPLRPGQAGQPWRPGEPRRPGPPGEPFRPGPFPRPSAPPAYPVVPPSRGWLDRTDWPGQVFQRLLERRIVLASGRLDGAAATVLCAQLLTLDAEGDQPIRLELQGLDAELPAALTVMGVLDMVRVPVLGCVAGRLSGPALGVLAACPHRRAYPNAVFALAEPRMDLGGTVTEVTAQEEQARSMLESLYARLAEVTGRDVTEIRADARRGRFFTVADAVRYGLVEGQAEPR
jgi:ATP-dependent Clp protease, protease subunit